MLKGSSILANETYWHSRNLSGKPSLPRSPRMLAEISAVRLRFIRKRDVSSSHAPPRGLGRSSMDKKILIIDDSRTARMFIKQCFEIAGFANCSFLEASQGEEALQLMKSNPGMSLVITDINMPVKDGISMLRDMRASESMKNIPVLVITST